MKRKTEAWLVRSGNVPPYSYHLCANSDEADDVVDLYPGKKCERIPLVRRDRKADAVLRAARELIRWWHENNTACNPYSSNPDPADKIMRAVEEYEAAQLRAKQKAKR